MTTVLVKKKKLYIMDEMVYDDLMSERGEAIFGFWCDYQWISAVMALFFFFIFSFFWCFAEGFSVLFLGFLWKNTVMIYKEKR